MANRVEFGRNDGTIYEPGRYEIVEVEIRENPFERWQEMERWLDGLENLGDWDVSVGIPLATFYFSDHDVAFAFKLRFG